MVSDTTTRVLLMDPEAAYRNVLAGTLAAEDGQRFSVEWVAELQTALDSLKKSSADAVLLTFPPVDGSGLRAFEKLRTEVPEVPVVILAAPEHEMEAREAVQKGAQDYLLKGETDEKKLARMLGYVIERKQIERERAEARQ